MTPAPLELLYDREGAPTAVRATGLLNDAERSALMVATLREAEWLVDASTGGRDGHRRARLLYTAVDEACLVAVRARQMAVEAQLLLGREPLLPTRVECQQTVHLDGGFYRRHADDQGDEARRRALSWVYYHHKLPRAFEGGELVIFSSNGSELVVEPVDDALVMFPSNLEHEVRDVVVPSRALADARFTVNGWVWR